MKKAESYIDELICDQALPSHYKDLVGDYLWPLVQDMMNLYRQRTTSVPWFVGLQGTQGSGKSTVCLFIKALLEKCFDLNVVILSLDDFYKTRKERELLAKEVHPLFATRGVPGTHDLALANQVIDELSELQAGESCFVPSFNKAIDDRREKSQWQSISGPINVILFEGWCVGVTPQANTSLAKAVNELERIEDANGKWRGFVNQQLETGYAQFYARIENLIALQAPSFKCVYQWRLLQETKLLEANKHTSDQTHQPLRIQTPEEIERFIAHYERLTRFALNILPELASWKISLNEKHNMVSLTRNNNLVRLE